MLPFSPDYRGPFPCGTPPPQTHGTGRRPPPAGTLYGVPSAETGNRVIDQWTDADLRAWVGDDVYRRALKLLRGAPPRLDRNEADLLEGAFAVRGGEVRTMIHPGDSPVRSRFSCTCPEMEEGACPHPVALVMAARNPRAVAEAERKASPKTLDEALALLQGKVQEARATEGVRVLGWQLIFESDGRLGFFGARVRPGYHVFDRLPVPSLMNQAPPYADETARKLLESLRRGADRTRFMVDPQRLRFLLPLLARAHTFLEDPASPLHWDEKAGRLSFSTRDAEQGIYVQGTAFDGEGKPIPVQPGALVIAAGELAFLYDGDRRIVPLEAPDATPLLDALLIAGFNVRPAELVRWADELLPQIRTWGPVEIGDTRTPQIIETTPVRALLLEEKNGTLRVTACARYGEAKQLVTAADEGPVLDDNRWYRRDPHAEHAWRRLLYERFLASEYQTGKDSGEWILEAIRGIRFLDEDVPGLEAEGVEVYGRQTLTTLRMAPGTLAPRAQVKSGVEWFETRFEFTIGDQAFDVWRLLRELKNRYILTPDGYVRLPVEQLERLRDRLDEIPPDGKVHRAQAALLTTLLDEVPTAVVDEGWREVVRSLRELEHPGSIPPPAGLQATLRPYQQQGLDWLALLAVNRLGGILADDMGLGKTLQTIAFLLHRKAHAPGNSATEPASPPENVPAGTESTDAVDPAPLRRAQTLVVAPSSVVFNWVRELEKFAPSLRVLRWTGDQRGNEVDRLAEVDVVLTTYGVLRRDVGLLARYRWRNFVLDEAQAIKNARSQTAECARAVPADFRLALSGTPLENHLGELWSYFEFAMPGFFGSERHFQERYVKRIGVPGSDVAERLRKRISPFVLRRLKKNVAAELPPKTEIILPCELSDAQRNVYEMVREGYRVTLFDRIDKEGIGKARMHVLEALLRLRQACCDPTLLPFDEAQRVTESAKREALLELVADAVEEDHKIIVFSQFTEMLDRLGTALTQAGHAYARLDGSTADREAPVRRFQEDPECRVFLISLRAGGAGLNLTAADYVVHYDPWWNPAVEDQATDRAYRIGQTRPVFVYKLIAQGTVEERMLELQQAKRGLVDQLLGEGDVAGQLSVQDLRDIFGEG